MWRFSHVLICFLERFSRVLRHLTDHTLIHTVKYATILSLLNAKLFKLVAVMLDGSASFDHSFPFHVCRQLRGLNLTGTLPEEFVKLSHLQEL